VLLWAVLSALAGENSSVHASSDASSDFRQVMRVVVQPLAYVVTSLSYAKEAFDRWNRKNNKRLTPA
jgi:predicted signal transduction protein with EAL and GGDEF domain